MTWADRMREAQRRGHEDALAGSFSMPDEDEDRAWAANYRYARRGEQPLPPLPWPAELAFLALRVAEAALFERIGGSDLPLMLNVQPRFRVVEGLRRRRARELGLGRNDPLPLLQADPGRATCFVAPAVAVATLVARRRGVRQPVVTFGVSVLLTIVDRIGWRRAGMPTSPPGRGRASAPA